MLLFFFSSTSRSLEVDLHVTYPFGESVSHACPFLGKGGNVGLEGLLWEEKPTCTGHACVIEN